VTSIASLAQTLKSLFGEQAEIQAKQVGLIQRARRFSATSLLLVLVLGWLEHPQAGVSQLARFAHSAGVKISKQALFLRLTQTTADWLRCLLGWAVMQVVGAPALSVGLLARFAAVIIEDCSVIELPAVLRSHWQGAGGCGSPSALKLGVRLDLRSGQLMGPLLSDGRTFDTRHPIHHTPLPPGSLVLIDAGYAHIQWLRDLDAQGIYFVVRPRSNLVVSTLAGQRLHLAAHLHRQAGQITDLAVRLGSIPRLWFNVRLLSLPVPSETVSRRQAMMRRRAKERRQTASPTALEGACWNLFLTNLPASKACSQEVLLLYRARWQIELLFKLWKTQGACLENWSTTKPVAILCELYAKLLAILVQHWLLLTTSWADPHRNLVLAAALLRDQVPLLLHALRGFSSLSRLLSYLRRSLLFSASIPSRKNRPSTSHQLRDATYWGLT
jgi:hypothetical protein